MPDSSPVRVRFVAVTNELDDLAMRTMATVLTRKGWSVRDAGRHLIVKEH